MKKTPKRILIPLLIVLLGAAAGALIFLGVCKRESDKAFEKYTVSFLDNMEKAMKEREEVLEATFSYDDRINAQIAYNMSYIIDGEDIQALDASKEYDIRNEIENLQKKSGLDVVHIVDKDGKILISSDGTLVGQSFVSTLGTEESAWQQILERPESQGKVPDWKPETDLEKSYDYSYDVTGPDGTVLSVYNYPICTEESETVAFLTGVSDDRVMVEIQQSAKDLSMFFDPLVVYGEISGLAAEAGNGIVRFSSPDLKEMQGKSLSELGMPEPAQLADGQMHKVGFNGTDQYVIVHSVSYPLLGDWVIVTCEPQNTESNTNIAGWIFLSILAAGLLVFFAMGACRGGGKVRMRRNAAVSTVTATLAVALIVTYICSMGYTSQAMEQININAEAFVKAFNSNTELNNSVKEYYENRSLTTLDALIPYIENYEDYVVYGLENRSEVYTLRTEDGQKQPVKDIFGNDLYSYPENLALLPLAEDIGADSLRILNGNGKSLTSSDENWYYELSTGELGYEQELMDVLDHKTAAFYRVEQSDDGTVMNEAYALPISIFMKKDENGKTVVLNKRDYEKAVKAGEKDVIVDDGLIIATGTKPRNIYRSSSDTALMIMESMASAQLTGMAVVDPQEGSVLSTTSDLTELDVKALGFFDNYVDRNSYRFTKVNGKKVFSGMISTVSPYALITVMPQADIQEHIPAICTAMALTVFVVMLILCSWFVKNEPVLPEDREERKKIVLPQSEQQFSSIRDYLRQLNPQGQAILFVKSCFLAAFVLLFLRSLFLNRFESSDLAFQYTMSENWERGVHLFSLSYAFFISLGVIVAMYLARTVVKYLVPLLGSGTETMVRLILSILEYIGVIVLIFYNLYLFGVQMGTVMTSAGIMTIVIGLGANSLIGDVLAGLFIIVEQEYKVGDIVTIDGFTGFVRSIGLRTTKVQDFSGNTKTLNNAKISGVLNLTDNYTTFFVTMGISTEVPVMEMEHLVNVDLKERLEDEPDLVAGPWFSGIPEVKGSMYTVSIGASSLQQNSWSLRKKIIQELLILMKEKGIRMS